jgi:hypothetical protein
MRSAELRAVGDDEPGPREPLRVAVRALVAGAAAAERKRLRIRRLLFRSSIVGLAAAAAAAAAFVVRVRSTTPSPSAGRPDLLEMRVLEGEASRSVGDEVRPVASGDAVWTQPEGRIVTGSGSRTQLVTTRGLHVTVGESTRLSMNLYDESSNPWIDLESGSVRCQVPKLPAGSHLSVRTPDAEVIVHGTVFSVAVPSGPGSEGHTCVRVEEGVVGVLHGGQEERLGSGQGWGCDQPSPQPPPPSAPERENRARARPPTGGDTRARPVETSAGLAEQNRLFLAALASEAGGDDAHAIESLRALLDRYPASPLRPEADAALARLRARAQHP